MTFLTELLCDVNNLIFKYIFKFKVDIPINARVIAVPKLTTSNLVQRYVV